MRFRQRQHPFQAIFRHMIAVLMITGLGFGLIVNVTAAQPAPGSTSIAHGVSTIPSNDGQSAWRVVLDTAQPASDTQPVERALGFVLAIDDPIVVSHTDAGTTDLVPAGGAAFVNEGDFEQRSSLDGESAGYYRVALVPPEQASDPANGDVVLAGDAFSTPSGSRVINLQSVTVGAGNSTSVTGGSAPSLVIVTSGSVTLDDGTDLNEGVVTTVDGNVSLSASETDAVVAVATIGDEVSLPTASGERSDVEPDGSAATPVVEGADPEPTVDEGAEAEPTSESSVMIYVEAVDCSNGDPATGDNCTPLEGVLFSLARAEGTASSETGITTDANGQVYDSAGDGMSVTVSYADGAPEGLVPLTGPFTVEDVQEGQTFVFVFGTPEQQGQ